MSQLVNKPFNIEGHISFLDGANMIQFMGRHNQIVHFKADRSLKCLQYDPYVYHVVYQWNMRVSFDLLLWFHC